MSRDKRKHSRTPIKLVVNLAFEDGQEVEVETWDISDGGIGIQLPLKSHISWRTDMSVVARVKGLPVEGPELALKVVFISDDRIGLQIKEP